MDSSGLMGRKSVDDIVESGEGEQQLSKSLGALSITAMGIGAIIGAGIFVLTGTAAAQYAGPGIMLSFVLGGIACAFVGLCYSEMAALIPVAGSSYTYTYATLGEFFAWLIGWDLILEYAVGNIAVAISWGDYFGTLLRGIGLELPAWLTTGYRTAALSANPDVRALLETAPNLGGIPILVNLPAFGIVMFVTWLLLRGAKETSSANTIMVWIKLAALALFVGVGVMNLNPANYTPFAPGGFTGIHQGAAIVFFAYIGFDAISTAAEETKDPQRNLPIGILGGLAICTVIYVVVGAVLTGLVPYTELGVADPLAHALTTAGFQSVGWIVALGAAVSMTAVLLVFQYGQPRIFYSMARDGLLPAGLAKVDKKTGVPVTTTLITGVVVAVLSMIGDAAETYDLTNIGTLFAFALVCAGVLVLRVKEPDRPRPFKVPFVWVIAPAGVAACIFVMAGLPAHAWERFGIWLVVGIALYLSYGYRHSKLRKA